MPDLNTAPMAASFGAIDMAIAGFFLLFIVVGIVRGFTNDVLGLFTWVGAVFLTSIAFPFAQPYMHTYIEEPYLADIVVGFLVFILSLIFLVAIAKGISGVVRRSALSGLDRSLGIVSGSFRATVLVTFIYVGALMFWKPGALPDAMTTSRLVPFVQLSALWCFQHILPHDLVPKRLQDHLLNAGEDKDHKPSSDALVHALSNPQPGSKPDEKNPENPQKNRTNIEKGYKIMERKALETLIDAVTIPDGTESDSMPAKRTP